MDAFIRVAHVGFHYGSNPVLEDVTFDVFPGDFVGLVGHNGSGKTTLMKVLLGLLSNHTGSITLFGQPQSSFHDWKRIGYVPQNITLTNPMFPATVEEIVSLGLLSKKTFPKRITKNDKKIIHTMLEQLSVSDLAGRLIGNLSGGQLQRVFLARAFITSPDLLILDEPSNALDALTREQFFSILKEFNKERKTAIILITHDAQDVGAYANKLLFLDQKVVYFGSFPDFCTSAEMGKKFGLDVQHTMCHQHT